MENIELIKLTLLSITTFCSVFTLIYLIRSKRTRLSTYSELKEIHGKISAVITVTNKSEKPIVISSIRFPLPTGNSEPRLSVPKSLKILRALDDFTGTKPLTTYASDLVVSYNRDPSKALVEGESITATIPLDDMMNVILEAQECLFSSKTINYLLFSLMSFHVQSSKGKHIKRRSMWEIRYYLASNYGKNNQLANIPT
ncbi:hypothetical protein [Thiomicrorhabdus arctica]|uniref:hypothetical protein n=1 Tax=Thiomicrorhabdus arctica TaxID=131540 RepID=UPI000370E29E|nr:hypothetical protein [Thiomicrorhabdus arctica]